MSMVVVVDVPMSMPIIGSVEPSRSFCLLLGNVKNVLEGSLARDGGIADTSGCLTVFSATL